VPARPEYNVPLVIARYVVWTALLTGVAAVADPYTFWVEPCPTETAKLTGCRSADPELARWALETWARESKDASMARQSTPFLSMNELAAPEHARIRIRWASGAMNLYGETEPLLVDGRRGAQIFVLPDIDALSREIGEAARRDPLFRDAVVYLTCLHESGHALGLRHTAAFADIMYSFQYGGDILAYFERYRAQLKTRADIAIHSGISDADRTALLEAIAREARLK
jgi:hypothetical protein